MNLPSPPWSRGRVNILIDVPVRYGRPAVAPDRISGGTPVNSLDVLDFPFVLTQRRALTAWDFTRVARRRGVSVSERTLEVLHRRGVLVPFLGIRADARNVVAGVASGERLDEDRIKAALEYTSTTGPELVEERAVGDLFDPADEPFRPWRETRRWRGHEYKARTYLYSHYQLLRLRHLRDVPAWDGTGRRRCADDALESRPHDRDSDAGVVLSAIEPVYLPRVVLSERLPIGADWEQLRQYRSTFDPADALPRLGTTATEVRQLAESLVSRAAWLDPLDNWRDLVRQVHPSQWDRLKGDALSAMDHRIAAEILFLFYEALVAQGAAEALPTIPGRGWHPLKDRLKRDRRNLDRTLSRFGLSPNPPVILVLEGETEMTLAPRVLEIVLGPRWDGHVDLLNLHGVGQRIGVLAAFAMTPRLGSLSEGNADLVRPPTRLLLALDAEGPYESVTDRRRERNTLVDRIFSALPREYQTAEVRRQLAGMIQIRTWSTAPRKRSFEFAHFTPRQLAAAIASTCTSPDVPDVDELTRRIARIGAGGRPLKEVWRHWRAPRPSKVAIADSLWPVLEKRIIRVVDQPGYVRIPLLRVAEQAARMASWPPRHGITLLRVRRPRPTASTCP